MRAEHERHGEFKPDQVITRPEQSILYEKEDEDMAEKDSQASPHEGQKKQEDKDTGGESPPRVTVAGEILLVDLTVIRRNAANPNYHTDEQVALLANNIRRYGLSNAIELKKLAEDGDYRYKIIAGEGRFLAYCHLRGTEGSDKWNHIPAIIRDNADDEAGATCGKRLSENALRWFNWAAECVEAASLKANGVDLKTLMESFGYSKTTASSLVAAGQCLSMIAVDKEPMFRLTETLSREAFIRYVVPLRIKQKSVQSEQGQKGFRQADPGAYRLHGGQGLHRRASVRENQGRRASAVFSGA